MNNRLYGNLIFELSKEGRRGYSLPANNYRHSSKELPSALLRSEAAQRAGRTSRVRRTDGGASLY